MTQEIKAVLPENPWDALKTTINSLVSELVVKSISHFEVLFEVKDDDVVGAKLIGQATIKASSFCINGGVRDYFTFTEKNGKSVG